MTPPPGPGRAQFTTGWELERAVAAVLAEHEVTGLLEVTWERARDQPDAVRGAWPWRSRSPQDDANGTIRYQITEEPMPRLSALVRNLTAETAFTVLAMARALKAQGKDVVELEIGDSPFPSTPHAKAAGIRAIEENQTGYCPSLGLPEFRAAAARFVTAEFGYAATAENVVVASGAKPFEQYFAEAVLDPGDGVLVFSPQFPTYVPNLQRRGARAVLVPLRVERRVPAVGRGRRGASWRPTRSRGRSS